MSWKKEITMDYELYCDEKMKAHSKGFWEGRKAAMNFAYRIMEGATLLELNPDGDLALDKEFEFFTERLKKE